MKKLYVKIADTHEKREHGLMKIKSMPKNEGMLFKFISSHNLSFWMKDTYLPLDIAFIKDNGEIFQIESMVPLSTKSISSKKPCKYAIEVNKGWFKDNNIVAGDIIGGLCFCKKAQVQTDKTTEEDKISPKVMLNRSYKELIEDAKNNNKNMTIIYETKDGNILPPKQISPPYEFKSDENGKHDSILSSWDNQTGGWKSFIINNIIDIEIN